MLELIELLIKTGINLVKQNPHKGEVLSHINTKGQFSIQMDLLLEKVFIETIVASKFPMNIYSEEIGIVNNFENPEYFISFDPLDGSTNYKIGKNTLPYGSLFAIFKMPNPRMKNIIASGAIEYTSGDYWIYDGQQTVNKSGQPITINQDLDITPSTPIYVDLHSKQEFHLYEKVSKSLNIRSEGSTIGNLRNLLNGVSGAQVMSKMKAEEVGAVVGLIKGASGIVIDHEGNSVFNQNFDIKQTYQIIAGVKPFVNYIQENLSRA